MLITILATAVVLGVLIFVHELGHFLTAKAVDIEVPRFSIGFGPRVIGFRRGETEYVLSLLPLGGYVKMAGMEEMEMIEGPEGAPAQPAGEPSRGPGPRDFESKSLPARTLVISAGVLMNLAFAFVVFSAIGLIWGVPTPWEPVIGAVTEDLLPEGATELARVPRGARVTAVNDETVDDFEDIRLALTMSGAGPATIHFAGAPPIAIDVPSNDSARASLVASLEPVSEVDPVLDQILEGSPAETAGLQTGDRVLRAAGDTVASWQVFVAIVEARPGTPVPLVVERDGERVDLTVTPETRTLADGHAYGRIGAAVASGLAVPRDRVGPISAVIYGAQETWQWVELTVEFLIGMFSGRHSVRNVGGPILIGQLSGQLARAGLESFLNWMGLLSVNLAILNLLPIPVLDGGQLVFLGVEAVRGRGLSIQQRIRLSQIGFVLILAIMAFAIGNDILRWIGL
jgi:regulator of sigma E protease